jgi:hypothetical protein
MFYLLTFQPFRTGVKKTVIIPRHTIQKLRSSSRNNKNEVLVKLDYDQNGSRPKKQILRRGTSGVVYPGIINREEIIIHTHPGVSNKDPITNAYETELRERPSYTDLKFSKRKGKELLVTPTGKILEFNAENANLKQIKNIESHAQLKANQQIPITSVGKAKDSAKLANKIFLQETQKSGVTYREYKNNKKGIKIKTEVK